jgi:hypothetical protein
VRAAGFKGRAQFSTITLDLRAVETIRRTVDHENRETFARSIGTFRKKG